MPKLIPLISTIVALAGFSSAYAEPISFSSGVEKKQLLELYTSQGCHSCPPAERWFNTLTEHELLWDEVVPVAFHVDYWDDVGWEDPFAASAHSHRQRSYARLTGMGVYTPGFVMNGVEWRNFFESRGRPQVYANANEADDDTTAGNLQVTLDNSALTASFNGVADKKQRLVLNVALLGFDIETSIPRGENAGKTISHDFVVLDFQQRSGGQQTSDGVRAWSAKLPVQPESYSKLALAAWVSVEGDPQPLQATGGWLQ